jgi:hypothetical protein
MNSSVRRLKRQLAEYTGSGAHVLVYTVSDKLPSHSYSVSFRLDFGSLPISPRGTSREFRTADYWPDG